MPPQQRGEQEYQVGSVFVWGARAPTEQEAQALASGQQVSGFSPSEGPQQQEGTGQGFFPELTSSFLRDQPVQNPVRVFEELKEAGVGNIARGLAEGQMETIGSGAQAAFNLATLPARAISRDARVLFGNERGLNPLPDVARLTNVPLGVAPVLGPALSSGVVEPAAQVLEGSLDPASGAGRTLGSAAGFLASAFTDKGLGMLVRGARSSRAATAAAEKTGEFLSAGQRQGANALTRLSESMVSVFPGGRSVMSGFRNLQQIRLVEQGVNRLLGDMANFKGTRLQLTTNIQRSVDGIIENLRARNTELYAKFDQALEATNLRLGTRGPPTRAQATRGIGGDEVTSLVPLSQAGASAAGVGASGVKVTSFTGDAVAEIATRVLASVGPEMMLVADPALKALVSKVQGLTGLAGRQIPVTVATNARSTLLTLARRLDNPLGSKEASLLNQIFDPIDKGIEAALRQAGGDELAAQWRTANAAVKQTHRLIDDTLFEKVIKMRDPENIAAVFASSNAGDLARMRARLPGEQWDQIRALILRDKFMAGAISGEAPTVARGGAHVAGPGRPLRVSLDEGSTPTVGRANSINETLTSMDEAVRGILLSDDELASWSRLQASATRAGDVNEQIGRLVASGIAAGTMIGATTTVFGGITGGLMGAAAGASPLLALGGLVVGSKLMAELLIRPKLMDTITEAFASGIQTTNRAGFIGQQILEQVSDEALVEFVVENNIPIQSLPPNIRGRILPQALPRNIFQRPPQPEFGRQDLRQ